MSEFALPCQCQNQLLVKGFNTYTRGTNDLIFFCELLETTEEIFNDKGEVPHAKKTTSLVISTNRLFHLANGYTRPRKPRKRTPKIKIK